MSPSLVDCRKRDVTEGSSTVRRGRGRRIQTAFTLIEVLVVVAIIALLITILLPSLSQAREQARRATCLANLHQIGNSLSLYSADHKHYLPRVGESFKNWIKENGRHANVGLLYRARSVNETGGQQAGKSYVGNNPRLFFCASNPLASGQSYKPLGVAQEYGMPGFLNPTEANTVMAYLYAVPMNGSSIPASPALDHGRGWRNPKDAGANSYPDLDDKGIDGRWMLHDPGYRNWLTTKRSITGNPRYGRRNVAALLADNYLANQGGPGVGAITHKTGYQVLYTDFHAKFLRETPMPLDAAGTSVDPSIADPKGPLVNSQKNFETWDYFSKNP